MIGADILGGNSLDRDIELILSDVSPEAISAAIAAEALDALAEAKEINTAVVGEEPIYHTIVDGRTGAELASVLPNGTIVFQFDITSQIVTWIEYQLVKHSPVRTGRYQKSHRIFADGVQIDEDHIPPDTKEIVLVPTASYARLIEPHDNKPGESRQAPDGVYQAVAALARRQFAGFNISFSYWSVPGMPESAPERQSRPGAPRDLRQPAIIINL